MKQRADWLAWSLQFIAGLVVGGILGLRVSWRSWRYPSEYSSQLPLIVASAALLGAGLASYYGDRLWLGGTYRVIPPDEIPRNTTSKVASVVTIVVGGSLILVALLRHLHSGT